VDIHLHASMTGHRSMLERALPASVRSTHIPARNASKVAQIETQANPADDLRKYCIGG
jgi:hypothetical protein